LTKLTAYQKIKWQNGLLTKWHVNKTRRGCNSTLMKHWFDEMAIDILTKEQFEELANLKLQVADMVHQLSRKLMK
jgi:hypothetical protein